MIYGFNFAFDKTDLIFYLTLVLICVNGYNQSIIQQAIKQPPIPIT
jgi:hypothetical protein